MVGHILESLLLDGWLALMLNCPKVGNLIYFFSFYWFAVKHDIHDYCQVDMNQTNFFMWLASQSEE